MGRFSFFLLAIFLQVNVFAFHDFRAVYQLEERKVNLGQLVIESFVTDQDFRIDGILYPSLAAEMLGFNNTYTYTRGLVNENHTIQLAHFNKSIEKKENILNSYFSIDRDFSKNEFGINNNGEESQISFDDMINPLDLSSLLMQFLIDFYNQKDMKEYTLIDDGNLTTFRVKKNGIKHWKDKDDQVIDVYRDILYGDSSRIEIDYADNPLRILKLHYIENKISKLKLTLLSFEQLN